MFRWPRNGRSMSTESSELSCEEGFLPTTDGKTWRSVAFSSKFWRQITDLKQLFGLKKQKRYFKLFLRSQGWTQLLERLVKLRALKWLQKQSAKTQTARRILWTCGHEPKHVCKILNSFLLWNNSTPPREWKFIVIKLSCAFRSFNSLCLRNLAFKSESNLLAGFLHI